MITAITSRLALMSFQSPITYCLDHVISKPVILEVSDLWLYIREPTNVAEDIDFRLKLHQCPTTCLRTALALAII